MSPAYPGYVYRPYPRMICHKSFGTKGYKIVNSEKEEQDVIKSLAIFEGNGTGNNNAAVTPVQEEPKKRGRPSAKMMFSFEE